MGIIEGAKKHELSPGEAREIAMRVVPERYRDPVQFEKEVRRRVTEFLDERTSNLVDLARNPVLSCPLQELEDMLGGRVHLSYGIVSGLAWIFQVEVQRFFPFLGDLPKSAYEEVVKDFTGGITPSGFTPYAHAQIISRTHGLFVK